MKYHNIRVQLDPAKVGHPHRRAYGVILGSLRGGIQKHHINGTLNIGTYASKRTLQLTCSPQSM